MPPDGEDAVEPPPVPVTPSHTTTSGRVALVLPTAEGGGAERSMVRLANGLHRAGITVDLVLGTAEGEYVDEIAAGVNVIDLRSKRMSSAVPGLVRYLRSRRPTAAVATLPHGNVALAIASRLARSGTRVYLREASTPSELTYGRFDVRDRVTGSLVALAYRQADGVIAVSNGVAADLHLTRGVGDATDVAREAGARGTGRSCAMWMMAFLLAGHGPLLSHVPGMIAQKPKIVKIAAGALAVLGIVTGPAAVRPAGGGMARPGRPGRRRTGPPPGPRNRPG